MPLRNTRILLIESDPDDREAAEHALGVVGARVTAVGSARDGLSAYRRANPHVIISDLPMPGRKGYALIEVIRALDRWRGAKTPVVALSRWAQAGERERALDAGFDELLPKPTEMDRLVETVHQLAGDARQSDEFQSGGVEGQSRWNE